MTKEELKKLIINKKGFPFYTDYWQQYFSRLSGDKCKEVLKLICSFTSTGEQEVSEDFAVDIVANSIITNITRDAIKREKRINASRQNGKIGGRPPKYKKPKQNQEKPKKTQSVFIKPTLQEIKDYCLSRNNNIDAQYFFDYYENGNWCDNNGKPLKNWKQKIITWESRNSKKEEFSQKQNNQSSGSYLDYLTRGK